MARLNSSLSAWPWVSLVVARSAARCASVALGTVRNESSLDTALLPPQPAATAAIATAAIRTWLTRVILFASKSRGAREAPLWNGQGGTPAHLGRISVT